MGGKKKLNLKQMERMQEKKDEQEKEKKKKEKATGPPREKRASAVIPPDPKSEKTIAELKKMHVLTPFTVASRYNIRMSAARDFLQQLHDNGTIQLVSGSHNIKIYRVD
jgi:small subunit ribosomal protein S25e